jgi:hypothetical protein
MKKTATHKCTVHINKDYCTHPHCAECRDADENNPLIMNCYIWSDFHGCFIVVLAKTERQALDLVINRRDADHWYEICQKHEPLIVLQNQEISSYTLGRSHTQGLT